MIELRNVSKYFYLDNKKNYILKDVSLTLPEVNIGILGRNGAGKSTLIRMLGKIEFPNTGSIFSKKSFSWPLGLSGGSVPTMTGRANVKFVCNLYNKSQVETREIIAYVQEFAELGAYFDMPIKTYSSGMKGRLGFGLSLAFDFDCMLIDETLSTGDVNFRDKAKAALQAKIDHCYILLVSHSMPILKEMCDAGLLLHKGELFYFDDIDEAINYYEEINKKECV